MKMITAIIRPERLPDVKTSLFREGFTGMSLSTVLGHGGEQDTVEHYRGSAIVFEFVEKVKLEIAVADHLVDKTIATILNSAQTGSVGDGKIFVQAIERVVRIRTGEEDNLALSPIPLPTVRTLSSDPV
jgi:nitrogen regulatory protein P-II 1